MVRLRFTYVIKCDEVIRDSTTGEVVELVCSYDERTRAGATPEGTQKAKGIIQWVSSPHAAKAEVRLFDRLFSTASPGKDQLDDNFLSDINPNSLQFSNNALIEPSIRNFLPGDVMQFERLGYFCIDYKDNSKSSIANKSSSIIFNRVVTLKDSWSQATKSISISESSSAAKVIDDILRVDFRVGKILSAERHPDADTLLVEKIDCGDSIGPRTVVSGIAKYFPQPDELVGKYVVVVCNLKPAKMRGILSEGVLLAASLDAKGGDDVLELLSVPENAKVGESLIFDGLGAPNPDELLKSKSALDMWKNVSSLLSTNDNFEIVYASRRKLISSAGPCVVSSLKQAIVR